MFKRIGVPLDGSISAEAALQVAGQMAQDSNATLVLVNVRGPVFGSADGTDPGVREVLAMRRYLEDRADELWSAWSVRTEVVELEGVPGRELCRFARESAIDLIVMTSHGRTGVTRLWLGSVAEYVSRHSPVPVLVVRGDRQAGLREESQTHGAAGVKPGRGDASGPPDRVVAGIDFSEASRAAARWVARCFATDSEIVLVHAWEAARIPAFMEGRFDARLAQEETVRRGAEARLREFGDELRADRMMIDARPGSPAECLAAAALDHDADLIVVGRHADRPGVWRLLSSTAERLLHIASVPVLLATDDVGGMPPTNVLVPVDDSALAAEVLSRAAAFCTRSGARLTVLHALAPALIGRIGLVSSSGATAGIENDMLTAAEVWTRSHVEGYAGSDVPAEVIVVIDQPAAAILSAARRIGADLIIMGSRGAGSVGRRIVGSVARSVLNDAPCPVLVVAGQHA